LVLHNGTVTVVDPGTGPLAITAEHVYRAYLKDKEEFPEVECQFGNVTLEPENYLVEANPGLDIATFNLPGVLLAATGVTTHTIPLWPPEPMTQGEIAILGGYPGKRRNERPGFLDSDFVTFISRVSQASDSHMAFQLNLAESHWPAGENIGTSPDLGGMSGGPVFRLREGPIERLEFVGVVYQAHTEFEIVRARQATHIEKNGKLRC
jgi:hypothetical protein